MKHTIKSKKMTLKEMQIIVILVFCFGTFQPQNVVKFLTCPYFLPILVLLSYKMFP